MFWWFNLAALLLAWVLTGVLRRYALSRSLMDVPNNRSSHTAPTPRGGGVAIVVTFLLGLAYLAWQDLIASSTAIALWGAGAWIAVIGFWDDHGHIPARWRLLAHLLGAIWAVAWLGGAPPIEWAGSSYSLGIAGSVIAVVGLIWLLNLYNFMDGIDGIASVEAISACLGGMVLCLLVSPSDLMLPLALLLAAVAGFLIWNFPPARIFMGDAGSGFLGMALGVFMLAAGHHEPRWLWCWLILLAVFIVDATWTLARRLLRRERVYEAHRSHAYQHATRRAGRHLPVTLGVAAINVFWLLPLAVLVALSAIPVWAGLLLAYVPLCILAARLGAGRP